MAGQLNDIWAAAVMQWGAWGLALPWLLVLSSNVGRQGHACGKVVYVQVM